MVTAVPEADAASALARLLPRLSRFASIRLDEARPRISVTQLYVLQRIVDGVRRGTDLARRIRVSGPTVSGIVDRLVAGGFAVREPDPTDRRAYAVTLTEAGRAAVADGDARLARGIADLLHDASAADRAALLRTCALIERALDARVAS